MGRREMEESKVKMEKEKGRKIKERRGKETEKEAERREGGKNKKLCYCRRTARRAMSVIISSTVETSCIYSTSTTNRSKGVRGLQLIDL